MTAEIIRGNCLDVMREMPDTSVGAVITDPPYHLTQVSRGGSARVPGTGPFGRHRVGEKGFMGKTWDGGGIAFTVDLWAEALRIAKPGTYLLAFGGTRTYHRMTCAIEDAGWEIHDCLTWLYGSGFPKHKSKLKPAWEPIVMARKPAPRATPLNIDACKIATNNIRLGHVSGLEWSSPGSQYPSGRWPANVILDEEAATQLDEMNGTLTSGTPSGTRNTRGVFSHNAHVTDLTGYGDTGGASRFFYCAKASRSEREAGLEGFAVRHGVGTMQGDADGSLLTGSGNPRNTTARNHHPTVKPVALMRWLVRLVCPPDGLVLDPFTGSGTTGIAAIQEGRRFVGIEREAEYVEIARARIAHAQPALGVA